MKRDITYAIPGSPSPIHAIEWTPDSKPPKAVVQIIHGMVEFIDRYDRFARFLARNGYIVAGEDHPGHGASAAVPEDLGFFGEPDGNRVVIEAIHGLRTRMMERYPDLPYFLLGHSMGSFFVQQYAMQFGEGISGMIVMGTAWQNPFALKIAQTIAKQQKKRHGERYRSELLTKLSLGSANKRIRNPKTPNDWLTKDEEIVSAYNANPWNTFLFTVNAYEGMFRSISYVQQDRHVRRLSPSLPVLFVSGAEDPIGAYGAGPRRAAQHYRTCGIRDVRLILYPGDRHEILNELDHEKADRDILTYLDGLIS